MRWFCTGFKVGLPNREINRNYFIIRVKLLWTERESRIQVKIKKIALL